MSAALRKVPVSALGAGVDGPVIRVFPSFRLLPIDVSPCRHSGNPKGEPSREMRESADDVVASHPDLADEDWRRAPNPPALDRHTGGHRRTSIDPPPDVAARTYLSEA